MGVERAAAQLVEIQLVETQLVETQLVEIQSAGGSTAPPQQAEAPANKIEPVLPLWVAARPALTDKAAGAQPSAR